MHATTSDPGRQREPLGPVKVRARFVAGATPEGLAAGAAILSVTEAVTGMATCYWCEAVSGANGQCVGFRLRKFGGGEPHDLPGDLSGCTCGDRTHRPDRPGGCRHMAALRQALPALTKATA
jgi:hypothetical protein